MGLLASEAKEFNGIKNENIEIGRNIAITCDERAKKAILNYRENGQFKSKQNKVGDFTPNMLREMQAEIDGRPTMGEVNNNDIYMRDDDR